MTIVQHTASLHPKTVTEFSEGEIMVPRRRGESVPRTTDSYHIVLDPRVLAEARRLLATGTYTKIEIVSATEAVLR